MEVSYGDILSEPVEMLIELEVEASWIHSYEGHVIPGLLRGPDPYRVIQAAGGGDGVATGRVWPVSGSPTGVPVMRSQIRSGGQQPVPVG